MYSDYFVLYSSLLHVWHHRVMTQCHINPALIKSKWNFYDAQLNFTIKGFYIKIIYIFPHINTSINLTVGFSTGTGPAQKYLTSILFFFFSRVNRQNHKCHVTNHSGAVGKLHILHYSDYLEVWRQRQQTRENESISHVKEPSKRWNTSNSLIFHRIFFFFLPNLIFSQYMATSVNVNYTENHKKIYDDVSWKGFKISMIDNDWYNDQFI